MKKTISIVILSAAAFLIAIPAQASLIGSTIFLSHRFPDDTSVVEGHFVMVQSGSADSQLFGSVYTANPESHQLLIDFIRQVSFANDPFHGHVAEFIPIPIQGVIVDTNLVGWDDSRLAFNQSSVRFNWAGLSTQQLGSTHFYATLSFDQSQNVIPEPSTLVLFALGIGAVFSFRLINRLSFSV